MLRPFCLCLWIAFPAFCATQPSREILELQRDVANLQEQVKALLKAHEAGIAKLEALTQQAIDAANKAGSAATAVNTSMQEKLGGIGAPVAETKTQVGQIAGEVTALQQAVTDLTSVVNRMQTQLTDVGNMIKVIQEGPAKPPAPEISATALFDNAVRDMTDKPQLALPEFGDYLKYYGDTEKAPEAQYYIAKIHYDQKEYEDALEGFDAMLEAHPKSVKAPEALYYKAATLSRTGQRTKALAVQRELQRRYPSHEMARKPLPAGR